MTNNNSFSVVLDDLVKINNNSLELVSKLNEATTSNADSVLLQLTDTNGNSFTQSIPSFGFLKQEIDRLDSNLQRLAGISDASVLIRNEDGSYSKIFQAKTPKDLAQITDLNIPNEFNVKTNWFFEDLLNPLMYITIDISNKVNSDTKRVLVKRLILDLDSQNKIDYFNSNIANNNALEYEELLSNLITNDIVFVADDDERKLPPKIILSSGKFDVMNFVDEAVEINGNTATRRKYKLNKLTYTDNLSGANDSISLKINDVLLFKDSEYQITTIDTSDNTITLKQTVGFDAITLGTNVLELKSNTFGLKEVQIPVGYDEYQVVFVKPVDDDFNTTSTKWSTAVPFYSGNLIVKTENGNIALNDYYRANVLDVGTQFMTELQERNVPNAYGLTPSVPTLVLDDFNVVQINRHKFETSILDSIKQKSKDKVQLRSEINELEISIEQKKNELNNTNFKSENEKRSVRTDLNTLIRDKQSKSRLYKTIIDELATITTDSPNIIEEPKYRVRGFWGIPADKFDPRTGNQTIVQFDVSYRYLKEDGSAISTESFQYTDVEGNIKRGYFSNWVNVKTKAKEKVYDTSSNRFVYENEEEENADQTNINQLDIPISKGEQVEIRVRSISEAGYPTNPLMSGYSESIIVPFPEELSSDNEINTILSDVTSEESRVQFEAELDARGLDLHLASSSTQNEVYVAHTSDVIASGFFNSDGSIINLFDELRSLRNKITLLEERLNETKGKLSVSIIDENGTVQNIKTNDTIRLFAGYYSEQVAELPASEQKGAIITKSYNLVIENTSANILELVSKLPGGSLEDLPNSDATASELDYINDSVYNNNQKYDKIPIIFNNVNRNQCKNGNKIQASGWQSSQLKSQFLYLRYKDVAFNQNLYENSTTRELVPTDPISAQGELQTFVWNGTFNPDNTVVGNGVLNDFCIHIDHPYLQSLPNLTASDYFNYAQFPPINTVNNLPIEPLQVSQFRHSSFFNLDNSQTNGQKQLSYDNYNIYTGSETLDYTYYPDKLGFSANDRYLIGSNTVGSYLYLAPVNQNQIRVEGNDSKAKTEVETGENNGITIPIIFQYRMTDYFGDGNTGLGRVGGIDSNTVNNNLTYSKKIGIDIYVKDQDPFIFDIEISSTYARESLSRIERTNIPTRDRRRRFDDLDTLELTTN